MILRIGRSYSRYLCRHAHGVTLRLRTAVAMVRWDDHLPDTTLGLRGRVGRLQFVAYRVPSAEPGWLARTLRRVRR